MSSIPVYVKIQNDFSATATRIQLWHQFGSNNPTNHIWSNVKGNGAVTSSSFLVKGSTAAGHDYWQISITLSNGQVWEHTSSWKTCTIESADSNYHATQSVTAAGGGDWQIPLPSGGCSTWLQEAGGTVVAVARDPENKQVA